MPTLATLIEILSTSLWAYFKSFGCSIEKNRKQVFSGHCLGSRLTSSCNHFAGYAMLLSFMLCYAMHCKKLMM